MKSSRLLFVLFLLCHPLLMIAQKDTVEWVQNGQFKISGQVDHQGRKIGIWYKYVRDGRLREMTEYYGDSLFIRVVYRFLYPNNIEQKMSGYIDSHGNEVVNGLFIRYSKGGRIISISNVVNGLVDGISVGYYDDGNLYRVQNYERGILNGGAAKYYANGMLKEYGEYKDDYKIGVWVEYYENGNKKNQGSFMRGMKIISTDVQENKILAYSENGELLKAMDWIAANADSLEREWGPGFPIKAYNKDGQWLYWDIDGRLANTRCFEKGTWKKCP